eukprot:COSAG02_NODE_899_length_16096_cov_19.762956_6_plen_649_part_00
MGAAGGERALPVIHCWPPQWNTIPSAIAPVVPPAGSVPTGTACKKWAHSTTSCAGCRWAAELILDWPEGRCAAMSSARQRQPAPPRDSRMSVVPIQGSQSFRQRTQGQAPAKIPPIPGNLGADFFAKLEYEARLKAGVVEPANLEDEKRNSGTAVVSFSAGRRLRTGGRVELDARLLRGIQSRCKDLGTPRKLTEVQREFKRQASGVGSASARLETAGELKEQRRRQEALAQIKAIGGRSPACGRRAKHQVQDALVSMQVSPNVVDLNRRPQWPTPRGVRHTTREFPFAPPVRTAIELSSVNDDDGEEPSAEQRKIDELRALAGEMTSEQKKEAFRKRQEEVKFRTMTPDDWRCETHEATKTKPQRWQWAGVAGALAQEDPVSTRPSEDPRWSERMVTLVEVCDSSELDPKMIHSIASRTEAAQWIHPDANRRTAMHAICQSPALHTAALEAILDHAPFDVWKARCDSEHGGTPLHLLCANQTALNSEILEIVLRRAAESLPLQLRSTATSALWMPADETGCTPLHMLCSNDFGVSSCRPASRSEITSQSSLPLATERQNEDFNELRAQVEHELEVEAAIRLHVPEGDRIHSNPADYAFVKRSVLLALVNQKPIPQAVAAAREELREYRHRILQSMSVCLTFCSTRNY